MTGLKSLRGEVRTVEGGYESVIEGTSVSSCSVKTGRRAGNRSKYFFCKKSIV